MGEQYHEPVELIPEDDRNIIRALISVKEEIEAIFWYHQRAVASQDEALRQIMMHNRDEEIEHAVMGLEYLRRKMPAFDEEMRTYLFTNAPITQIEELAEAGEGGEQAADASKPKNQTDLGIGKMK